MSANESQTPENWYREELRRINEYMNRTTGPAHLLTSSGRDKLRDFCTLEKKWRENGPPDGSSKEVGYRL